MFSFFKSDKPPYNVDRIKNGELLDKAIEKPVSFFFKCWMNKRPRKALIGSWFVLHEDKSFIYWGSPVFKRLFSDQRIVDQFYKTSCKELEKSFPNYKQSTGSAIRLVLSDNVRQNLDPTIRLLTLGMDFKAKLLENTIEVETTCTLQPVSDNHDSPSYEEATYFVVLERDTLDLIKLHRIK